jgi:hypothetical protein
VSFEFWYMIAGMACLVGAGVLLRMADRRFTQAKQMFNEALTCEQRISGLLAAYRNVRGIA